MLTTRIIVRLDVKSPQGVVKGRRMDGLRVVGGIAELASRAELEGADEVLYVDVVASLMDKIANLDMIRECAEPLYTPLTVCGGIRSLEDVRKVLLAGADKVAINTAALKSPVLIMECARAFGSQAIVGSIEAKRVDDHWECYMQGGREPSGWDVVEWAQSLEVLGAGEILLTAVDKDGLAEGTDLECVKAVTQAVKVPVIASGGIGTAQHVLDALDAGADAVAIASLFYKHGVPGLKDELSRAGVNVRWQ